VCGTVWCGFVGVSVCCVWDSLGGFRGVSLCRGGQFAAGFGERVCAVCGIDFGGFGAVSVCCI